MFNSDRQRPLPRHALVLLSLLLITPAAAAAATEGRVTNPNGHAIWRARVALAGTGTVTFTDTHGRFTLGEVACPCKLEISHLRFEDSTIEMDAAPAEPLAIVLEPKPVLLEEVVVSGSGGGDPFTPATSAASAVSPEERPAPPSTLTEMVTEVPGVSENGQGGNFIVFSVRGVSRERILTMVSGMRVVSERRAGVSTSFIDPLLLGSADVLRGPSATFYGSGALGGVVHVVPRKFAGWSAHAGYESEGQENVQVVGWGDHGWSIGAARREARNGEAPDGSEINSHFKQYSSTVARRWDAGPRRVEALLVSAFARDIGKATTDFPARVTNYPYENHLLAKLAITSGASWRVDGFVHPNELHTRNTTQAGGKTDIFNEAFDMGFTLRKTLAPAARLSGNLGVDYFGRRSVDSREVVAGEAGELRTLDGGELDEAALYGSLGRQWGDATIQGGTRFTWQRQQNGGLEAADDAAWNGFASLVLPVGNVLLLSGEIGNGLRFPSLSERFFTGTTPRGGVVGNPDLDPERSLNLDLGLRWRSGEHSFTGHVFHNRIEDYIERVEIAPDTLSFRNLVAGSISGLEIELSRELGGGWRAQTSGHLLRGRGEDDEPLADVPARRFELGVGRRLDRWRWDLEWQFRDAKDDPGSGEKVIPSARLLAASVRYALRPDLALSLSGANLLDEDYFASADEKVPLAAGRSLALGLAWGEEE